MGRKKRGQWRTFEARTGRLFTSKSKGLLKYYVGRIMREAARRGRERCGSTDDSTTGSETPESTG